MSRSNGHGLFYGLPLDREAYLNALVLAKLFRQAHDGRDAQGDELSEWRVAQGITAPPDPRSVLTAEELAEFDKAWRSRDDLNTDTELLDAARLSALLSA